MKTPNFDTDDFFLPANDNEAPDPTTRRVPRYVTQGQSDVLLALAGFDPNKIPRRLHSGALRAAWCFEQGLFHPRAIGLAADLTGKRLSRTLAALREAALPGIRVA